MFPSNFSQSKTWERLMVGSSESKQEFCKEISQINVGKPEIKFDLITCSGALWMALGVHWCPQTPITMETLPFPKKKPGYQGSVELTLGRLV